MSDVLEKQKDGYLAQMKQVESSLKELDQQRQQLLTQREQLKGAVFALDSLFSAESQEAESVPVTGSTEEPVASGE